MHLIGLSGLLMALIDCGPGTYLISNTHEEAPMFLSFVFQNAKMSFFMLSGCFILWDILTNWTLLSVCCGDCAVPFERNRFLLMYYFDGQTWLSGSDSFLILVLGDVPEAKYSIFLYVLSCAYKRKPSLPNSVFCELTESTWYAA